MEIFVLKYVDHHDSIYIYIVVGFFLMVGCRLKANCRLVGPRPIGGLLSVGVFLRDPNPYLREFRRKPRKTPDSQVDKRDRGLNPWHLSSSHFEKRYHTATSGTFFNGIILCNIEIYSQNNRICFCFLICIPCIRFFYNIMSHVISFVFRMNFH